MPKSTNAQSKAKNAELAEIFSRADQEWQRGKVRSARKLFLLAAKKGDKASQLNVGYFYDQGIGVRRNRTAALHWYERAYRSGDASAANNIGTIWNENGNTKRALAWFRRAINLGNDESNIEVAKLYMQSKGNAKKAIPYLRRVCESNSVSQTASETAKQLLKKLTSNMVA